MTDVPAQDATDEPTVKDSRLDEHQPNVGEAQARPASLSPWTALGTAGVLRGAALNAGLTLAAAVAAGVLMLIAIAVAFTAAASNAALPLGSAPTVSVPTDLGSILGALLTLALFSLGGEFGATVSGGPAMAGTASAAAMPLLLVGGIAVVAAWSAFRAERRAPLTSAWTRIVASAATALAVSLVLLALAALGTLRSSASGATVSVTAATPRNVVIALIVLTAAILLGRVVASRTPSGAGISRAVSGILAGAPRVLRESLAVFMWAAAAFVPAAFVTSVIVAIANDGAALIPLSVLLIGNGALFLFALGTGGALTTSVAAGAFGGDASQAATLFAPSLGDGWGALLYPLALLVALAAALWIGVRRGRASRIDWRRAWHLPTIALGAWIVSALVFLAMSVSASGSVLFFSGAVQMSLQLAWWTPVVIAVVVGLIGVGADVLPRWAAAVSPEFLSLIAGKRVTRAWASATTDVASDGSSADTIAPELVPTESPTTAATLSGASAGSGLTPDPKVRKRVLIGLAIVGGIAVLGGGAAIALNVMNSGRTAEAAVARYVELIAAGEAAQASELVDPGISNGDRVLLTDEVLGSATDRITVVRVVTSGEEAGVAYVDVEYRLDGADYNAHLRAEQLPSDFGVLANWRVIDPLVITVPAYAELVDEVMIGGVGVRVEESAAELALYPGIYELALPDTTYFSADPVKVVAAGDLVESPELIPSPTDELAGELQRRLNALIDECVKSTDADPEGCPFGTYAPSDTPVTWSVDEYPTVELSDNGYEITGEVAYSYTSEFFGTNTFDGTASVWEIGRATLEDGELVIEEF
ncbi:hypothetical protein LQ757_03945 [Agromyces sp. SYSU K20354]|uniref:hypothetical protein n=1 Tax=Agromyces cavernae TaxID=2898659 RepID=UPI001E4F1261|nr:hypothetical protein [Agromyces cavernae]MCD2441426.1 hypothetical protein [Agromyces cavernae]